MGLVGEILGVVFTLVFEVLKWAISSGQFRDTVEAGKMDSGLWDRLTARVRLNRMPDPNDPDPGRKPGQD